MKLRDYILKNYNGRNVEFANANKMSAQQVGLMVKKGIYYVYDGMLMISKREVKIEHILIDGENKNKIGTARYSKTAGHHCYWLNIDGKAVANFHNENDVDAIIKLESEILSK